MRVKARGFQLVGLGLSVVACAAAAQRVAWDDILRQPADFYASDEAARVAAVVVDYQRPSGGWPKNIDMTVAPRQAAADGDATIDNGATTTQIRLLARVREQRPGDERIAGAALRGIDYLLAAQYPSGGWPQTFPLKKDYSRHITFNDNAMVNVLTVLDDVAGGKPPFAFVDADRRRSAAAAVARGLEMILKAQVTVDGRLTAWCAQHDAVTLEPRPARAFEPASLSGSESVGIVRFLMARPATPAVVAAVDAAVAWLQRVRLPDGRWARFYELGTGRPIFSGRDGVVRYRLEEVEKERQEGYAWYGTWGKNLVEREYPAWKKRAG